VSPARRASARPARALLPVAVALAVAAATPALAMGAGAGVRLSLTAGALSAVGPASLELPAVHLDGAAVTVRASFAPVVVTDTRAGRPGWTLVVSADRLRDALGRALGPPLVLLPAQARTAAAGIRLGSPRPIDGPTGLAVAEPGSGGGRVTLAPAVRLRVPADAPSGRYTARLVLTVS
jgi:hypothetical protein